MKPTTKDAYRLLHDGSAALAVAEHNGMRIDVPYVKDQIKAIRRQQKQLQKELEKDAVWKTWKRLYGGKAKLSSRVQLAGTVFKELGHPCRAVTEKTGQESTEEAAFRGLDLPFIPKYFLWQKLHKVRRTYLEGILSEVCGEYLHPSFNLHTVQTYRSSSSGINFQNIPVRDPVLGKLIRKGFIPDPGCHIVEVDLGGAEVRVAYCYHLDPTMKVYLTDPKSDMHRDTATDLFGLSREFLVQNAAWAKKTVRDWAKNRFVFPEFYGSVHFQCAPHLWEAVTEQDQNGDFKIKLPDGKPLIRHLAESGIRSLGACDPRKPPLPGTFEHRVLQVQKSFWQTRFPVYTEWKERWQRNYESRGYFDMLTGFRCHGIYKRNQVINYPVQGAAFHVLLWSLIRVQNWLNKYRMKAKIVGQIHDSIIACVPPDELDDYLTTVKTVITQLCPKHWPWITIPLEVEAEVCPVDGSWDQKKVWVPDGNHGTWGMKA